MSRRHHVALCGLLLACSSSSHGLDRAAPLHSPADGVAGAGGSGGGGAGDGETAGLGEESQDASRAETTSNETEAVPDDARPARDAPALTAPDETAIQDSSPPADCRFEHVAVGGSHACAITEGGRVYCWGDNQSNQLGVSHVDDECVLGDLEPFPCSHRPVAVPGLTEVIDLGLTASDSCALDGAGVVWCWGVSQSGIFNNELAEPCDLPWLDNPSLQNLSCSSAPVPIAGIDQAISIGSWGGHCAVEHTGSVKCWVAHMGRAPTPVVDVAEASQTDTSCAVTTDGRVHCWWCNDDGQRGDETLGPPQEVGVQSNCEMTSSTVAWPGRATQVTSGYDHACLVDADGSVACWGGNLAGQLGIPSTEPMLCNYGRSCSTVPVRMPGIETAVQVSAGYGFTCVLDAEGVVTCIGLGLNGHIDLPAPARQIAARYGKACAVLTDGRVFCWGGVDGVQQVPFCERDG